MDTKSMQKEAESVGRSTLYMLGKGRRGEKGPFELAPHYAEALARFRTGSTGRSARTLEIYSAGLNRLFAFLQERWGSPDLEALSREHIESWVAFLAKESGYSPQSVAMSVQAGRVFCERLVEIDALDENPFRFVKNKDLPKVPRKETRPITVDEMASMYRVCKAERTVWGWRDAAIITTLFYGGMRASELLNIREQDIAWQEKRVYITRGKGGDPRPVGLKAEAMAVLERYIGARRKYLRGLRPHKRELIELAPIWVSQKRTSLTAVGLSQLLKARAAQAGVEKPVNPHVWRHTAATLDAQGSEGQQMLEGELREKYGWSPTSPQVYNYTRATVRERAASRSAQVRGPDGFRP